MTNLLADLYRARRERLVAASPSERSFVFGGEAFVVDERVGVSLGSRVWDGATALCEYLAMLDRQTIETDARVLELGAGVALCSIVFRKLFPHAGLVVASDREEQREIIVGNIAKNKLLDQRISFQVVDWTRDNAPLVDDSEHFRYVLMSDVVVGGDKASVGSLIRTLCAVTSPGSKVFMSQSAPSEDASVLQVAMLQRQNGEPRSTPLQDFVRVMESNYIVTCNVRNRVWTFERRTGAWFTSLALETRLPTLTSSGSALRASTDTDESVKEQLKT